MQKKVLKAQGAAWSLEEAQQVAGVWRVPLTMRVKGEDGFVMP